MEYLSLGTEIDSPGSFLVMVNGLPLGKHSAPEVLLFMKLTYVFNLFDLSLFSSSSSLCFQRFAKDLRILRRSGNIGKFVSIFVNKKQVLFLVLFTTNL